MGVFKNLSRLVRNHTLLHDEAQSLPQ